MHGRRGIFVRFLSPLSDLHGRRGLFVEVWFPPSELFYRQDIWGLVNINLVFTPYYPNESPPLASHGLALAQFREDREELCDLSRRQSSLNSLNDGARPQQQFVQFEYLLSTCVLRSRSSPVQPSSGLQRELQLHQSQPLAGNNPVSAQHIRASQSAAGLPRPVKNPQKR